MSEWQMYWLTRCDAIAETAMGLTIFFTMVAVAATLFYGAFVSMASDYPSDKSYPKLKKIAGWALVAALVIAPSSLAAKTLIPTTSEMAAIIVIPAAMRDERVKEIGTNTLELANTWLSRQVEAAKGEVKQ